jgi:predicted AAA+ superfamily ATPase
MMTLKFIDYVVFHMNDPDLNKINWDLRKSLQTAIAKKEPKNFYDRLVLAREELAPIENKVQLLFNEYLLKDGYPELLTIKSYERCRSRLQDYLSLTLFKDVVRMFEVRHPAVLEELLTMMADSSSQLIEFSTLSKNLSIKQDTLRNYLQYLEDIFLISLNEYYSKNRALRIKKNHKGYVSNVALLNNILGQLDDSLFEDKTRVGHVVETLVMEHLKRLNFCLFPGRESKVFYWRDRKDHEVDLVIDTPKGPIPIEVKFRKRIDSEDFTGLLAFNKVYATPISMMITEDALDIRDRIILIPTWMFLLIC